MGSGSLVYGGKLTDEEKNDVIVIEGTWRGFKMPEGASLFKKIINNRMIYEIGKAIGRFHRSLKDFPLEELYCPIPECSNIEKELDLLRKPFLKLPTRISFYIMTPNLFGP